MIEHAARCLGRMPLHGGWGLLRFTDPDPDPAAAPQPGQLLTVRGETGAFTLPVYQRADETIAVLLPPAGFFPAEIPARDEAVILTYRPATPPTQASEGETALVVAVDSGLGGGLAVAAWLASPPMLVIVGGEAGVPARPRPSRYLTPQLPGEVIAALPQLEEAGIPSRIALHDWQPGCFDEGPAALLERYLAELPDDERRALRLYAFAPEGTLEPALPGLQSALAAVHAVSVPRPG